MASSLNTEAASPLTIDEATDHNVKRKPDYANAGMLQAECHMELLEFREAAEATGLSSRL